MLKINFSNADVRDDGFGLKVNGESLEDLISEALGTKAKGCEYNDPRLKNFKANSCDVFVIIKPNPQEVTIEADTGVYNSVKDLEDCINERLSKEITAAES